MSKKTPNSKRRVEIRWDADDYRTLRDTAQTCDLTVSEFVRRCAMGLKILTTADQTAVSEIRKIAGMLKHYYPKNSNWTTDEKRRYWAGYEKLVGIADRIEHGRTQPSNGLPKDGA
jgi:hypothetical protein